MLRTTAVMAAAGFAGTGQVVFVDADDMIYDEDEGRRCLPRNCSELATQKDQLEVMLMEVDASLGRIKERLARREKKREQLNARWVAIKLCTDAPTAAPTDAPTAKPTNGPTDAPTPQPTAPTPPPTEASLPTTCARISGNNAGGFSSTACGKCCSQLGSAKLGDPGNYACTDMPETTGSDAYTCACVDDAKRGCKPRDDPCIVSDAWVWVPVMGNSVICPTESLGSTCSAGGLDARQDGSLPTDLWPNHDLAGLDDAFGCRDHCLAVAVAHSDIAWAMFDSNDGGYGAGTMCYCGKECDTTDSTDRTVFELSP